MPAQNHNNMARIFFLAAKHNLSLCLPVPRNLLSISSSFVLFAKYLWICAFSPPFPRLYPITPLEFFLLLKAETEYFRRIHPSLCTLPGCILRPCPKEWKEGKQNNSLSRQQHKASGLAGLGWRGRRERIIYDASSIDGKDLPMPHFHPTRELHSTQH